MDVVVPILCENEMGSWSGATWETWDSAVKQGELFETHERSASGLLK